MSWFGNDFIQTQTIEYPGSYVFIEAQAFPSVYSGLPAERGLHRRRHGAILVSGFIFHGSMRTNAHI